MGHFKAHYKCLFLKIHYTEYVYNTLKRLLRKRLQTIPIRYGLWNMFKFYVGLSIVRMHSQAVPEGGGFYTLCIHVCIVVCTCQKCTWALGNHYGKEKNEYIYIFWRYFTHLALSRRQIEMHFVAVCTPGLASAAQTTCLLQYFVREGTWMIWQVSDSLIFLHLSLIDNPLRLPFFPSRRRFMPAIYTSFRPPWFVTHSWALSKPSPTTSISLCRAGGAMASVMASATSATSATKPIYHWCTARQAWIRKSSFFPKLTDGNECEQALWWNNSAGKLLLESQNVQLPLGYREAWAPWALASAAKTMSVQKSWTVKGSRICCSLPPAM